MKNFQVNSSHTPQLAGLRATFMALRLNSAGKARAALKRALALALLVTAGVGMLELGAAPSSSAVLALDSQPLQHLWGPSHEKPFYWRKDLAHLVLHKNQTQVEQLLGPPDGIFKHEDGRQLWFYHRLSADRHTRAVDGMTVLKIAPDGRIQHVAFRRVG